MRYMLLILVLLYPLEILGFWQSEVDRIFEDGIEVIINHKKPYIVGNKLLNLRLEMDFIIDAEDDDFQELDIADIENFWVDSVGNIYLEHKRHGAKKFLFKFDSKGEYQFSFVRQGDGPGEIQQLSYVAFDEHDNIIITAALRRRLIHYSKDGEFTRELRLPNMSSVHPLSNGNYFATTSVPVLNDADSDYMAQYDLNVYDSEFKMLKELDSYKFPNLRKPGTKTTGFPPIFEWSVSNNRIWVGHEDRGYEIWMFDFNGLLVKKVKKEYEPVAVSKEYKEARLSSIHPSMRKRTIFPRQFPPYQAFFSDDKGRLYVVTNRAGDSQGEFVFDIFNPEGVFICEKSLPVEIRIGDIWARANKDKYYSLVEKENGFKRLTVSRMIWQ